MKKLKTNILHSEEDIRRRVKALAADIDACYDDDKDVVCVCVLRGAVMFFTDLMKELANEHLVYDFVTLSSYENAMYSSGRIKLIQDLRENVEGKHVLVVEDIVDSGFTVDYLRKYFAAKQPLDVRIACLLDKPMSRKVEAAADFVAFELKRPAFIIGYGLDLDQKYRNLNGIYEVVE